jgi:hypothetical protein
MARKQKVPNHLKKRLEREERKRKVGIRQQRQYFLIVCEGEKTEPLYFEAFKADLPKGALQNTTLEIEGEGKNTLSLIQEVQKIIERRERASGRQYDQVWAVFDRDSFKAEHFNNAIFKARDATPEIFCAWSNEAFELWYLLHFEFYQDAASRHDYQARLEQAISQRTGKPFQYRKNDPGMYALLKKHGNTRQAKLWAIELENRHEGENFADHNPCTKVYKLVQALNDLFNSSK